MSDVCERCQGERWVCENHDKRPWNESLPDGCVCGAGAPCPDCNASKGRHDPPAMPPGTTVIWSVDGMQRTKAMIDDACRKAEEGKSDG